MPTKHHQRLTANLLIICFALLLRILVGIHPHSGQDDYQGPTSPSSPRSIKYGGDYEAQRHWMELTYHLPISEWYWYDLNYWGLDYPPLTAYVSWMFGWIAHAAGSLDGLSVLKNLVALDSSRGFEDPGGKMFMRFSVLMMDLLVYFSAVWALVPRLVTGGENQRICLLMMALAQPAIILIDHGHFQYNTVSLGLALWSFYFITMRMNPFARKRKGGDSFIGPIIGSVLFSLALNFKQMELYHAPAVFAYLLGRCFGSRNLNGSFGSRRAATRFCLLGITVISTFALLWFPFTIYPRSNDVTKFHSDGIAQVIKRLFPFQRGLFEGKVSNIWCALSVKPFSIRQRVPENLLPFLALVLTLILILPPCWFLFKAGRSRTHGAKDLKFLLWGSAVTALAFFLASFQVHEKGILISLAPLSLLIMDAPRFISWFSIVATWTLWPLIVIDRLANPYACSIVIFLCIRNVSSITSYENPLDIFRENTTKSILHLSEALMVILHIAESFILPPSNLPDLFPVLWSIFGCGMCSFSYLVTIWVMSLMSNGFTNKGIQKGSTKSKNQNPGFISLLGSISLLGVALLPTSDGFMHAHQPRTFSHKLLFSKNDEAFSPAILERARVPLYWEKQRLEDAKPVLDLSKKDTDTLSLSEEAIVNGNTQNSSISNCCYGEKKTWEDGSVWLKTKEHLMSLGVIYNGTTSELQKRELLTPKTIIDKVPQLVRLPSAQVIESANFLHEQCTLMPLIQLDPTILTYTADDLCYGMEYLSNMMARGDKRLAVQMIQTQLALSPQMAVCLFRMGIDGGIDERRVSNALGNATAAAGKAVEFAVGDAGRTYREFKRLKGGKNTLS